MGISYSAVYGCFKSISLVTPISPLPPIFDAPEAVYIAFSTALIGDNSHLRGPFQRIKGTH
jgi:hypothetical protein